MLIFLILHGNNGGGRSLLAGRRTARGSGDGRRHGGLAVALGASEQPSDRVLDGGSQMSAAAAFGPR